MTPLEIFEKYNTNENETFESFTHITYSGGHNKHIVKYPKTDIVIAKLKEAYKVKDIDYNWITDYFGGTVSKFVTGIKQKDANNLGKIQSLCWDAFVEKYSDSVVETPDDEAFQNVEWNKYAKPRLIDYCTPKTLNAKKITMDTIVDDIVSFDNGPKVTMLEFLNTKASFRTISKTQYNLFTPAQDKFNGGVFTREGRLKAKDPERVGEFVCQLSIDTLNYNKDLDSIIDLWKWKTERNEKRGVLEEHFGYDTKHMSHTIRLLIGGRNILVTGEYHPRLEGAHLKLVKSILNGLYTYDKVVELAEKMEGELNTFYKTSTLQQAPNHKKANKLLLQLSRDFS
jgi:hypothetical protein